ncbi:MAG TPA: ChbG/HpnK family deacetylase [Microvirga sp.]|jgi:predicted glycoside hydrolase/deacetylase ChbG (UPF0249 family)
MALASQANSLPETQRSVVLCADDFALTEGVSRGILELAEAGRISATSAMTNRPAWADLAGTLKPLAGRIGVGLHLNFTTGEPLGPLQELAPSGRFPEIKPLMRQAFAGRLPRAELRGEIERQLDAFVGAFGSPPAFVDGHQHAHVLPVIRGELLAALGARGWQGRVWLRDPSDRVGPILRRQVSWRKALVVGGLAFGFRRAARAAGFDTNEGFSGYSPFDLATTPERVFGQAFLALGPRPLVMCHPGYWDEGLRALDPDVESRDFEKDYLRSEAFDRLLAERGLRLAPRP